MAKKPLVTFHNRLRLLRAERGISRQELADAVKVHVQTIGYIERRQYNLSVDLAFRLAQYFNVSLDALFSADPFELLTSEKLTPSSASR